MRNQLFIVMLRSRAHLLFRNCSHFYKLIRCELTFPMCLVKLTAEISTKHCLLSCIYRLFIIYTVCLSYIPSVYHIYRLFIIYIQSVYHIYPMFIIFTVCLSYVLCTLFFHRYKTGMPRKDS